MTQQDVNTLGQTLGVPVDNWQGAKRPDGRVLEGHDTILERLDISKHGKGLYAAFCLDDEGHNWTYLPYGPFKTEEEFLEWLSPYQDASDPFFYVVLRKSDGAILGQASYLRVTPEMGSVEVGHIHYSPTLQRTQIATECMYLMMKHAFEDLGYRRYEWKCNDLNAASKNAALRLGFSPEGVFRKMGVFKGYNRDTAWFSIVDDEWDRAKAGFERWLMPSNFSEDGTQKTSLQTKLDLKE